MANGGRKLAARKKGSGRGPVPKPYKRRYKATRPRLVRRCKAVPGLGSIPRSLLPSILARMSAPTSGFALALSEEQLLGWAAEQSRAARPVIAEPE